MAEMRKKKQANIYVPIGLLKVEECEQRGQLKQIPDGLVNISSIDDGRACGRYDLGLCVENIDDARREGREGWRGIGVLGG